MPVFDHQLGHHQTPHFTASGFLAPPLNTYLSSLAVCCVLPNSSGSCSTPDVQTETSSNSAWFGTLRFCYWYCIFKKSEDVGLQRCGIFPCRMWKIKQTAQEETFHCWLYQTCSEHCSDLVHAGIMVFAKQFSIHLHLSPTHWSDLGHYICGYFTKGLLNWEKESQFIYVWDWLMRIPT